MIGEHRTEVETLGAQLMEWKQGIASESLFWDSWMRERGGQWPGEFERRLDPETPLDPWVAEAARSLGKAEVSILDVGSGPVPVIGYKLDGVLVRITAVDPLAAIYRNLTTRYGLNPPVTPIFAPAEELSSFFDPNSFDIVHCRNALDHSFDPLRGINEMLKVVRIGALVLLRHHQNEAENAEYNGFHHYNFDCRGDRFLIWNKCMMVDVGDLLNGQAHVAVAMPGHVDVTIRKISDTAASLELPAGRMRQYLEAFVMAIAEAN